MLRVRVWIGLVAVLAGGASAFLILTSNQANSPVARLIFGLLTGWSFVGSGLVAWSRRPENRVGLIMVATGFAWFGGSLQWANDSIAFTAGIAVQVVYLALAGHMLLAFPSGWLGSRLARAVVVSAYLTATVGQLAWMLFADFVHPLAGSHVNPLFCFGCPPNALRIARDDGVAFALFRTELAIGALLSVVVFAILVARWHRASTAWRRTAAPVLWAGAATAAVVTLSVVNLSLLRPLEEIPDWFQRCLLPSVPLAFLAGLLLSRWDRAAVARLIVELGVTHAPGELQDALAKALHDPSLVLAYWMPDEGRYVDAEARQVELPREGSGRVVTPVERDGRKVAGLIHDGSLLDNPELLDAVRAAAGLALENEYLRGSALDPSLASQMVDPGHGYRNPLAELTDREREVLARMDERLSNQATRWAPDLVEVSARSGRVAEARELLAEFERQAEKAAHPWALAAAARCRGLLAGEEEFDREFQEALSRYEESPAAFERARTELCYGERLRRAGRRVEARTRLCAALDAFERLGVEPWAERARAELRASGEKLRRRDPSAGEELTPQEAQVALIVAQGATNREAGAALFLSPKTIEAHLGRIYRKLGIRSRTELAHLLATEGLPG